MLTETFPGHKSTSELGPGEVAVASSLAKVVASVMTYPHEVQVPLEQLFYY